MPGALTQEQTRKTLIMNRRNFINSALTGAAACSLAPGAAPETAIAAGLGLDPGNGSRLDTVPVFCAHEHWGSIAAIGSGEDGFRADLEAGAEPEREVSLWDIVLDPYFGGWIGAAGHDPQALAKHAGCPSFLDWWRRSPGEALGALAEPLRQQSLTGAFQCLRRGIKALHGVDLASFALADWQQADAAIGLRYRDMFAWYGEAMKRLHVSALVRPVHPEFFLQRREKAAAEAEFTRPILRIDPLLSFWKNPCPRRERLEEALGIKPHDARSWRVFIAALFDLAASMGNVGIKQLQAYSRSLDFPLPEDSEIPFPAISSGEERILFQNWVMHECCRQAHERRWPHQVHTGTHNLAQSSPLPLESLARRYPGMKLVLLHCWPYIEESAFLAKMLPNVYLDPCWQPILNPAFLADSFRSWLGYVPTAKIMCSQDATSIEMAAGSIAFVKEALDGALFREGGAAQAPQPHLGAAALDMLHNNAVGVYGVGTPIRT